MGLFTKLAKAMGITRGQMRILVIGLDNSGKSTLINHIKPSQVRSSCRVARNGVTEKLGAYTSPFEATPTVGFQEEEFAKDNINFTMIDMSGQSRYRTLWEHYFTEVQAIIFVVDSTDRIRSCVVKEELTEVLSHKEVRD
ncbi:unnamed protein product, partial [Discosporangium mesarthrocarpum]